GAGRAAAHERPSELGDGRAFDLLIAQVGQCPIGIGQKYAVRRAGRLVHVADRAPAEPQLVDTHQQPGSITRLLRGLGGFLACRLLGGRRRRRVDVVYLHAVDGGVCQGDRLGVGGVFDVTAGRQDAAVDGQVVAVRDRLEVIEQDVRQVDVATESRVRLSKESGLPGGEYAAR